MVLKYRYIGKGITDNNGIAHITEDAEGQTVTGYTGTGKGLTQIVASTDDQSHISDGSLQSKTYSLWDCIYYEDGTKLSTWTYNSNQITASQNNGETTFATTDTSDRTARINNPSTFSAPYCTEFKVVELTGTGGIVNWASGQNGNREFTSLGITNGSDVKVEVTDGLVKFYVDGEHISSQDRVLSTSNPFTSVGFTINNGKLVFKDYKIYSI